MLFPIRSLVTPGVPSGGRMPGWRGAAAHPHATRRCMRRIMCASTPSAARKRCRGTQLDEARLRDLAIHMAQIAHGATRNAQARGTTVHEQ